MGQKIVIRAGLLGVAIVLLAFSRLLPSEGINRCVIDRSSQKPAETWIKIPDGKLHNGAVLLIWVILGTLSALVPRKPQAVYDVFYAALWFHCTYWILYSGKGYLEDSMCSPGHSADYPNGISGHYCYFCFCMLGLPLFFDLRLRENPELARDNSLKTKLAFAFLSILIVTYMSAAMVTLYRTYMHGYHSARQVFLGTALGTLSHVCLEVTLGRRKPNSSPNLVFEAGLLGLLCLTGIAGYFSSWPIKAIGHAIGTKQIAGNLFCWLVIIVSHKLMKNEVVAQRESLKKTQ